MREERYDRENKAAPSEGDFMMRRYPNGGWILVRVRSMGMVHEEVGAFTTPKEMIGWLRDNLVAEEAKPQQTW